MELEHRLMPLVFVITGTANVLLIKYADILQGECQDGKFRHFQHPVVQTVFMFLGQIACYLVYKSVYWFLQRRQDGSENENIITRGGREFSSLSFVLPAFLDAIASILLFTGLYLTYASTFQMIRGAAIIFVGIFSSIYLNQTLIVRHWMAMFTICCGVTVIMSGDVARVIYDTTSLPHADANAVLTGNLLVLCAQVFHGAQIVYEEKHLKNTEIPAMQATGFQGIFGLGITLLLALALNFVPTELPFIDNSRGVFDDLSDVFSQLHSNSLLSLTLCIFILTAAFHNYAALSIVKFSSGANRILADSLRSLMVFTFALLFDWEYLNFMSIMGFIILLMGAIAYRNAIFLEWYRSLMARIIRSRYADLNVDGEGGNNVSGVPTSRPADVI